MKALCSNCHTSNVECKLYERFTLCENCYSKMPAIPKGKIQLKKTFKERWNEHT